MTLTPIFKIHCSQIGKIMGGINRPTDKQLIRIDELTTKPTRTDKQQQELTDLIAKRDAQPQLQAGAKTYCQEWVKERLYGRFKQFTSKYTEKGNECENAGIKMVADHMGYGLVFKNEITYSDDHIIGTPDLDLAEIIEDIKCSWDCFTFPLFDMTLPDKDYFYQGQGYMALRNKSRFAVNYCLIDTPTHLIDREAFYLSKQAGHDEVDMDLYDEVFARMTYGADIPERLRLKRFEFDRDDTVISAIRGQVELCRVYIEGIWQSVHADLTPTP